MIDRYSIVIHPSEAVVELFKNLKKLLKDKSGRFASCNSLAHVTIIEFEATPKELKTVVRQLEKFVATELAFHAVFDRIQSSYQTACAVALPREDSKKAFQELFKRIRKVLKVPGSTNGSAAHVSVGRKLNIKQLQAAKELFSNVEFEFLCNQLALRKYNENRGQYDMLQLFPFLGKPHIGRQLSLEFN